MTLTIRIPSPRALALLAVGAVLGAAVVAPVAAKIARPTAEALAAGQEIVYTRASSCAGLDFYPTDDLTYWDNNGTLRVRRADRFAGQGVFRCDPGLPHGARVTKVQFTIYDNAAEAGWGYIDQCQLLRSGLTVATAQTYQVLGEVPATGDLATPGVVRYTDTTIDYATIDNTKFGYWLACHLESAGNDVGIFGANVIYSITAAKG
jgi:hypothetical protein